MQIWYKKAISEVKGIIQFLDSITRTTMAFKYIVFASIVAVASAGAIEYATPVAHAVPGATITKVAAPVAYASPVAKAVVSEDYDPHPQYSFSYEIQDAITGDTKSQHETRDGDVVQGSYSLIEADGSKRTVEYTADPEHGFNAVVHREPATVAIKAALPAAKIAAPLAYATPVAKYAASPVAYSAPVYPH